MIINSSKWAKLLNSHLPWILMMFLISIQSSISSDVLSLSMPIGLDKLIHFSIFGILGWLMARGFVKSENTLLMANFIWLIPLFGGLFAILDEFHQALVPGRSPDFIDWIADFLGIVFFMWLYKKKNLSPMK